MPDEDAPTRIPDHVDNDVVRRADRHLRLWLNGDIDGVDFRTTDSGERIVQPYDFSDGEKN